MFLGFICILQMDLFITFVKINIMDFIQPILETNKVRLVPNSGIKIRKIPCLMGKSVGGFRPFGLNNTRIKPFSKDIFRNFLMES